MFKILLIFLFLSGCSFLDDSAKRILIVVTSHSDLGTTGRKTGAYISEITHPYLVFTNAGHHIDFASPKGGKTPLDGLDKADSVTTELLNNPSFMNRLNTTMKLSQIDANKYDAIYFAGGHGTMFDFPDDKDIQRLAASVYEAGGVVAAVCHGPSALVNVKLSGGEYLVLGKEVAGFTNNEEQIAELITVMPFLLESKLVERGAQFIKSEAFKKRVVVSQRLVTGQNPASAQGVGKEIVKLLSNL